MQLAFFSLGAIASISLAAAQPVISEFMASNESTLTDENGDYSDWIEIKNPTTAPINLQGWHLTDKADQPTMWTFPAVTLQPGAHLVVFASSKNRAVAGQQLHTNFSISTGGEYLGLIAPDGATVGTEFAPSFPPQMADVSYGYSNPVEWVKLVGTTDPTRVHVPSSGALGTTWRVPSFNDSSWTAGTLGVGYDQAPTPVNFLPFIGTNVGTAMSGLRTSVYIRSSFNVPDPSVIQGLEIRTQYDDGYAAFLNTSEAAIDQFNAPASLQWNSTATGKVDDVDGIPLRTVDISNRVGELVAGSNLLAVHGLNFNAPSTDLLIAPELWAKVPSGAESRLGFFPVPTPGAANPGNDGLMLTEKIIFSRVAGTFTGTVEVTLSGAAAGQTIRYTTNGSVPTATSTAYTGVLSLSSTTLLRAKVFDGTGASGQTATAHYQRLSTALATRQSNLPMVILDARGQGLNDTTRTPAYFQLFDRNTNGVSSLASTPTIATRQGLRWRGSSSASQPKKPYSVEFWDDADESRRIPVLGMTEEADWVFYAPYDFDRAYTRNAIIFEMSRRMGRWAPNTRFVEVFFNSTGGDLTEAHYAGVYAITEQIKMNSRRLGYSVVEPAQLPPAGPINPLAQGDWTGGYLLKIDRPDADEYNWHTSTRNFPTFVGGTNNAICMNRPKLDDLDGGPYTNSAAALSGSRQVQYIQGYVQAFEDALTADKNSNFSTRNYLQYMDRDAWVDYLIMASFAKNVDALRLSAYFHKPANLKLIAGPLWDFDRSMDSYDSRDNAYDTWNGTGDGTQYFTYDWWGDLCKDPDFAQAYYDRWAALRKDTFSNANLSQLITAMGAEIENSAGGLGSAAARDAAKWTSNSPRQGAFSNETNYIAGWAQNRASWMDRRRFDQSQLPDAPVIAANGSTVTLTGTGTLYYTLDGSDPRANGGAPAGIAYTAAFQISGSTTLTVRARSAAGVWSTPATQSFNLAPVVPVFVPTISADWAVDSNWDTVPSPYPNGIGKAAIVGSPATGNRDVDFKVPVTIGSLTLPQGTATGRNRFRSTVAGSALTFNNGNQPALLKVDGTGVGYAEFELTAGVVLQSTLKVEVTNTEGAAEYGALRMRETWSGPGGLTKTGPGAAAFTGDFKTYSGPTRIEEGVLRVSGPSTMLNSSSVTVLAGGQLRLTSASSVGVPRVHTFGGDLFLSGTGRDQSLPESASLGRSGALRYDPGTVNNEGVVTNPVELVSGSGIHVEGSTNLLKLTGGVRGTGTLLKTGGGTLSLPGNNSAYSAAITVNTGAVSLRGTIGSTVTLGTGTAFDAAGTSGAISGAGSLVLPATALTTPQVSAQNHSMLFTRTGAPVLTDTASTGNALLITSNPGAPASIDIYLDLPSAVQPTTSVRGGYLLPSGTTWNSLLGTGTSRVFVKDAAGTQSFQGQTWSLNTSAILSNVPASASIGGNTISGRMLEIRFDGKPVTYATWRSSFFNPTDAANPAVSGPLATPFGDGVANILRYALGVQAGDQVSGRLPSLTRTSGNSSFSFPYDARLRGIRWIVEATSDLTDWSDATVLFDSNQDQDLPVVDGWLSIPEGSAATRRFFRLRVSEDPNR